MIRRVHAALVVVVLLAGCGGSALSSHAKASRFVHETLTAGGEALTRWHAEDAASRAWDEGRAPTADDVEATAPESAIAAYDLAVQVWTDYNLTVLRFAEEGDDGLLERMADLRGSLLDTYIELVRAFRVWRVADLPEPPEWLIAAVKGSNR